MKPKETHPHDERSQANNGGPIHRNKATVSKAQNDSQNTSATSREYIRKPSEISKLHSANTKYCGGSREPIRRL